MELSCLPSSALRFSDVRCRQIMASPHTIKHLGTISSFSSSSRMLHSHIAKVSFPTQENRTAIFFSKSCPKLSTNGAQWLKAVPAHVDTQEATSESEPPQKNDAVQRFLRPFSIYLIMIQFISILLRRMVENPQAFRWSNWSMFSKICVVFTSLTCSVFFVSCINQIFDIKIDRINKPDLPLASGELPIEFGWLMVLSFVGISLFMAGTLKSLPFLIFNFIYLLMGVVYSIPPFRTKTSTIGAPLTISMGLGFFFVLTVFAGAGAALELSFRMSSPIIFIAIFGAIFCFAMGILKDISDVEGDKKSNVPTLATIIGVRKTLLIGVGIQILNHFGAILAVIIRPKVFKSSIMIPTHIISVFYLLYQAWQIEQANYEPTQTQWIYARMWFAYFIHYFLLPFV